MTYFPNEASNMDDMSTIPGTPARVLDATEGAGALSCEQQRGCRHAEGLHSLEEVAWKSFQSASARSRELVARDVSAHCDLSSADYLVLSALSGEPLGAARLFELASCLGWEKSRLSHQVARMVSRGLVEKRQCPSDKRGAFVALTGAGRERLQAAAPAQAAAVRRLFVAHLSHEQLVALASACQRLLAGLEKQLLGQPPSRRS